MNVKWYLSDLHACGHIRGEIVARVLNLENHRVDCKTQVMLSDYPNTDVMVFQRQTNPRVFDRLLDARSLGIPTVYDIDDNLFDIPEELKDIRKFYHREEVQRMLKLFVTTADLIVASTQYLADRVQKHTTRPVVVVENGLDNSRWLKPKMLDPKRIVIGWMASSSHKMDASLVSAALARIMLEHPEVEAHLIGWVGLSDLEALRPFAGRVKTMAWQGIDILPSLLADFSIGICPLQNNDFNHCKSGIKALQYWASSTPVVFSRSPAYECVTDGLTGLGASIAEEWYSQLKALVTDPALRRTLGANGRKCLETKHDIAFRAKEWVDQFTFAKSKVTRGG